MATGHYEMSAEEVRWTIYPRDEGHFTRMMMNEAMAREWMAYHTHDSRRSPAGFPDLVMVHPEKGTIYIELKMPGNYPTPDQRVWMTTLLAAGNRVYLWYPKDWKEVISVLEGAKPEGYEKIIIKRRKGVK